MSRVTINDVKSLVTSSKSDAQLQLIIDVASRQVDRLSSTSCGSKLDGDSLTDVELYLSAHLVSITDAVNNKTSETFENYSVTIDRGVSGTGVLASQFGQMANMISGGCLAESDKRKAGIMFIGGA